jgi:hypothetical protein
MRQRALTNLHQLTVAPMSTHGEVREILIALVQQMALSCDGESRRSEYLASDAHQEPSLVNHVSALV